jgi:hypothetical protein
MSDEIHRQIGKMTRRSLLVGGTVALAGAGAWEWIRTRHLDTGLPWPLRAALNVNEQLSEDYFRDVRLAPTFRADAVEAGRVNGDIGIEDPPEADWRLHFGDHALDMADIRALPKVTMITELKCIEGWSRILQWGGVSFRDFVARYPQENANSDFVSMETPDGEYYVGLDRATAMHPQTLLAYEMNGQPLTPEHGAPLRLVTPLKYGIKNLKRIGKIEFSLSPPKDYWAERGYDWYAGF